MLKMGIATLILRVLPGRCLERSTTFLPALRPVVPGWRSRPEVRRLRRPSSPGVLGDEQRLRDANRTPGSAPGDGVFLRGAAAGSSRAAPGRRDARSGAAAGRPDPASPPGPFGAADDWRDRGRRRGRRRAADDRGGPPAWPNGASDAARRRGAADYAGALAEAVHAASRRTDAAQADAADLRAQPAAFVLVHPGGDCAGGCGRAWGESWRRAPLWRRRRPAASTDGVPERRRQGGHGRRDDDAAAND